jgi:GlpG protein
VTWTLCAVVIVIWAMIQFQGGHRAADYWGWQPATEIWQGKPWALLTSALVHVELWHVAFNVYWLWVLGRPLEQALGPGRLLAFTAAAAFVSSAAQLAVGGETGIGFSGAGYAWFGFAWIASMHRPDLGIRIDRNIARAFAVWLLVGIFGTYLGLFNFGNAAHVSGGIFGVCAGFALVARWKVAARCAMGALLSLAALICVWAPWSGRWHVARASSAYYAGDYARAVESLDRSARHGEDPAWVAETKARIHRQTGQTREFQADVEALRALDAKRADRFVEQMQAPAH